jgi:hypothetical protein
MIARILRVAAVLRLQSEKILMLAVGLMLLAPTMANAAIVWDGENATSWWFDPVNWNISSNANNVLPPGSASATDIQINNGYGINAEGVVYDPTNDPNFANVGSFTFPSGYGPQTFDNLYISRATTSSNLLTVKGDMNFVDGIVVGRSSGVDGVATTGRINQVSGNFLVPLDEFDLAGPDTSQAGIGNGIYDYRGGVFDIGSVGGPGMRMSHGSGSINGTTAEPTGASGVARFIVHNPNSGGYVRAFNVAIASFGGIANTTDGGTTNRDPDGINRGVGIFEFHYENGQTRPFQVPSNLSINNGFTSATGGTRSSRLDLVLNEAACVGAACVPNNIGLFDVDFGGIFGGLILGTGDLNGNGSEVDDRVFSSADGTTHYREGDMVSAVFGSTQYNWTISYTGDISWLDADNSVVDTILGAGNGKDVVLIGHSSVSASLPGDFNGDGAVTGRDFLAWQRNPSLGSLSDWQNAYNGGALAGIGAVPEPTSLVLLCLAVVPFVGRRRA